MYEYPEVDEEGKKFRWASRKGGFRYRIYEKSLNDFQKKALEKEKSKISKKEYGRLAHLINSNPRKWKKGKINIQIIDNNIYRFIYNDFDEFKIVSRNKWKG